MSIEVKTKDGIEKVPGVELLIRDGARIYTNSTHILGLIDTTGFQKLYDTSIPFGNYGERLETILDLNNETTITNNMREGYSSTKGAGYDAEYTIGAFAGYAWNTAKKLGAVKLWLGRYEAQQDNSVLHITVQYADIEGEWHDIQIVDILPDTPYPVNIFEVGLNSNIDMYGLRWIHKDEPLKYYMYNVYFFGMLLYAGGDRVFKVPQPGVYDIPEGYDGYGAVECDFAAQAKSVTPTSTVQVVTPDTGYDYLSQVTIAASEGFSFTTAGLFQYPSTVTIPDYVTSLSNSIQGFTSHTEITSITIASRSSTLNVGAWAFSGCTNLSGMSIAQDVYITLADGAFYNCSSLTNASFEEIMNHTLSMSGSTIFQYCTGLTSITVPYTTGDRMFDHCTNLVSVTITDGSVTTIASDAFLDCTSLTSVTLPDTITTIQNGTFAHCAFTSFTFPSSLQSINTSGFDTCPNLVSVDLPATLTYLANGVFYNCQSLTSVTLRSIPGGSGMNSVFSACTAVETFVIPSGWNVDLNLTFSNVLTHDTLVDVIANLYDFTGGTAHTLTIGATNLAKLSAAEIAVATDKNWTVV